MTTSFSGAEQSLRPTGLGRYVVAIFLLVWLAGWAVGETMAIGFLGMLLRSLAGAAVGKPAPVPGGEWIVGGAAVAALLFIGVWLTVWTIGGVSAITHLLRSLFGEDRLQVSSDGLLLERRVGPLSRARQHSRSTIRRVRLRRHDKAVVMDTATGIDVVTTFGSVEERRALVEWLRSRLLLPEQGTRAFDPAKAPRGWRVSADTGVTRLTRDYAKARAIGAVFLWGVVLLLVAALARNSVASIGGVIVLVLMLALSAAATWVTFSRRAWLVREGRLTAETRCLTWSRERVFTSARLDVERSVDSDGDESFVLKVTDADGSRRIASGLRDETDLIDLAHWLAARTRFPLKLPSIAR
ncbi:MAG: hypothetical protein IT178_03510 [Acidobacteria bacterium]|nr:hypothetical protein [Acidobacteriota bacterium]